MEIKKILNKTSRETAVVDTNAENVVVDTNAGMSVVEQNKPELTESEINAGAKKVGQLLAKEDKVTIIAPKDKLNPDDDNVVVCINGYKYKIKRGVEVEVPRPVKDILKEAGYLG